MLDGVAGLPEARAALPTFARGRADIAADQFATPGPATQLDGFGHFDVLD